MEYSHITPPEGLLEAVEVLDEANRYVRQLLVMDSPSSEAQFRASLEAFVRKNGRRPDPLPDWIDRIWRGRRHPGRKPAK